MSRHLPAGTLLASYEVQALVGAGGMGEVYRSRDVRLNRTVAIKILIDRERPDAGSAERFYREARAVSALNHPNICTIYDIGEVEGLPYLVLEFLDGSTLRDRLREGPLPLEEVLHAAVQIADALEAAHGHRIVHRDITSANIFMTSRGQVKVLDFGIAKLIEAEHGSADGYLTTVSPQLLTAPGAAVGTASYMSPEQARGERLDGRSDLFSFGVVLYEMATGKLPFQGDTAPVVFDAILNRVPVPVRRLRADLPPALEATIELALEKDRSARIQSATEFRARLQAIQQSTADRTAFRAAADPGGRRRTSFVGRESEQSDIRHFLDLAIAGRGGLVLIGGEPGIGKTRLVEEISADARGRGVVVLTGHCYDMQGMQPYLPFVEVLEAGVRSIEPGALLTALGDAAPEAAKLMPQLRHTFPDIAPAIELPLEQERRYLLNSLRDFFVRAAQWRPLVVVVEDLHWADEGSLLLLGHLAQRLAELPLLMLATYREEELSTNQSLAHALGDLLRGRLAHDLRLPRLPASDVAAMLRAQGSGDPPPGLLRLIHAETEGNPLFVEEVFRQLSEERKVFDAEGRWRTDVTISEVEVPRSVRLLIERRLQRLGEPCRRALATAAVIGRNFDYHLLAAVSDLGDEGLLDAIEEAERSHLVEAIPASSDARYTFTHELIRHTLLGTLAFARRQRIHGRIADTMERLLGDRAGEQAGHVAHHLQQAGGFAEPAKTLRYLTLAGERALAAAAFEEALRLFDAALARLGEHDARGRADAHYARGHALRSLGRIRDTLAEWKHALALYEAAGDRRGFARVAAELARELANAGLLDEAIAITRTGIERVGDVVSAERCLLFGEASYQFAVLGNGDLSAAHITQAMAIAGQLGDRRLTGRTQATKATFHWASAEPREEAEAALAAADVARTYRAHWDLANALTEVAYPLLRMGRTAEAAASSEELDRLATGLGHWFAQRIVRYVSAVIELMRAGHFADLETASRTDIDLMAASGQPWGYFGHINLGVLSLWRGAMPDALSHFDDALDSEPPVNGFTGSWAFAMLGRAYAGTAQDALRLFDDRRDELPQAGRRQTFGQRMVLAAAAEALAVLEEHEASTALLPLLREGIESGDVLALPWGHHLLHTVAGMAAATGRRWTEAEMHYTTALAQAEALPHRIEQPEVRRWYARMLIARGSIEDRDKAAQLLQEAIGMYGDLGMPMHVDIARTLLIDRG